jgi:hypothetical protein
MVSDGLTPNVVWPCAVPGAARPPAGGPQGGLPRRRDDRAARQKPSPSTDAAAPARAVGRLLLRITREPERARPAAGRRERPGEESPPNLRPSAADVSGTRRGDEDAQIRADSSSVG